MTRRVVGVDIGSASLRGVEVEEKRGARATIVRHHEVPLPDGAVKNGEVIEINTVAAVLKQLWSAGGFTSKKVVLGVGNPKVLVRDLTVPRLSRREIREALPYQVQDVLPVPVADALLDFYPISESDGPSGRLVTGLLVAAVKDAVMANVRAVQEAGLQPVEVDLIPFAMNRVLVRSSLVKGTVALVDIGSNTTNVIITRDGVPQFVRIIPAGGADVTRALVSRLGVTTEEAEAGKRRLGLAIGDVPEEQAEAASVIHETTHELLNSLRNTLGFFVNSRRTSPIDRVVLSGGGAAMSSFGDALMELTRIPVETGNPFDHVALGKTAGGPSARASEMTVALGLALGSAA